MDAKYLAEIKAREQAATKGPWEYSQAGHIYCKETGLIDTVAFVGESGKQAVKNASFIAHARTDISALLADNAAKDQQIATLKRALEMMVGSLRESNFNCPDADYFIQQAQEQEGHDG